MAEDARRRLAYRTAMRLVFSFQDRDRNGETYGTEWRVAGTRGVGGHWSVDETTNLDLSEPRSIATEWTQRC